MEDYLLYHYPLCPLSRKVRFLLNELSVRHGLVEIKPWERNVRAMELNPPEGEIPILLVKRDGNYAVVDSFVIAEYLVSLNATTLLPRSEREKAEVRKIEMWFDKKFYNEASLVILRERVYNSLVYPHLSIDTKELKESEKRLNYHLAYLNTLLNGRKWFAGEKFSLADITAAAQLSSLDYLGEIQWDKYRNVKNWYLVVKSRPSFASILTDVIPGFKPYKYYDKFDF